MGNYVKIATTGIVWSTAVGVGYYIGCRIGNCIVSKVEEIKENYSKEEEA